MVIPSCSSGNGGLTNILSLTSQKNKSSLFIEYIAAACHLFVQSSSQQEALKTHWLPRQCRRKPVDWSPYHILYGVRFRPKDPAAPNNLIISDHSVWFIMVCMLHSFTYKSSFSSDHFIMICMLTGLHSTQCIQIISSSNQNFIRSSSWRSLSNLCL